jgi:hypothetical protein
MRPRRGVAVAESAELQSSSLYLICPSRRSSAASERVRLALRTLRHELGVGPTGRSWHVSTGATCSCLGFGLEFVEGLGGLSEGVGDGLVPVHVGAAGAEFARALLAQSFRHDQADRSDSRRLDQIGFGRALNDRGGLRLGGGKRARDDLQDGPHPDAITGPLEGVNAVAAELKCGGPVV